MSLGDRLKELRNSKQLSMQELASFFNTSKVSISYWESGKRQPKDQYLIKYAQFFDVPFDWVKYGNDKTIQIINILKNDLKHNDNSDLYIAIVKGTGNDLSNYSVDYAIDNIEQQKKLICDYILNNGYFSWEDNSLIIQGAIDYYNELYNKIIRKDMNIYRKLIDELNDYKTKIDKYFQHNNVICTDSTSIEFKQWDCRRKKEQEVIKQITDLQKYISDNLKDLL